MMDKGMSRDAEKRERTIEKYKFEYFRCSVYLMGLGIEKADAHMVAGTVVEKYKNKAFGILNGAPHTATLAGIKFEDMDKIAAAAGRPQYDPIRIQALVWTAYSRATQGGTRVRLERLLADIARLEKGSGYKKTPPLIIGAELVDHYYFEDGWIWSKHLDKQEKSIALSVKTLLQEDGVDIKRAEGLEIERAMGIELDERQRWCYTLPQDGLSILTGGPGTGKTTIIRCLCDVMEQHGKKCVLCAPTGAAAKRMAQATGREASTIHRLLGIHPYMDGGYKSQYCLPENAFLVVDEVSMLDTDLAEILLREARYVDAVVLLVGDEDQLPAVGPGAVLSDLMTCGRLAVLRLQTTHRQDPDSFICKNAVKIKEGDLGLFGVERADMLTKGDGDFFHYRYYDTEKMIGNALAFYDRLHDRYPEPGAVQIYTPVRDTAYDASTYTINRSIHDMYRASDPTLYTRSGLIPFSVGEPVIITRNDYDLQIVNGDRGVVIETGEGMMVVDIDGRKITLTGEALQYVELGYASTIHKAQGSECEACVILLPSQPACLLTRGILYTAITRAKEKCVLLYDADALEQATMDVHGVERRTGLMERLEVKKKRGEVGACSKSK